MKTKVALLLLLLAVCIIVPVIDGAPLSIKIKYMSYACDPACEEFKVLNVDNASYSFLKYKDISVIYYGKYLQDNPNFNVDEQHTIFKVEGKVCRRSLFDYIVKNPYCISAVHFQRL